MKKKIHSSFSINLSEAKKFAKISGDFNKIHLDKMYGLNSFSGEIICHGCLVILKIFKKKKLYNYLKKESNGIEFNFNKFFIYDTRVQIQNRLNKINVIQNKRNKLEIKFIKKLEFNGESLNNFKKKLIVFKKTKTHSEKIDNILMSISKYVGMTYPGENSLIQKICIVNKKENFSKKKKVIFFSKQVSKFYPFIYNYFEYENFKIFFISLIRPKLILKKSKPNLYLKNKLNKISGNVLVIGASNGIGRELCELFHFNKKIKVIGTFNNSKFKTNKKNIIKIKFNIFKDIKDLKNIIKKYKIKKVYYMATPKININSKDLKLKKSYYDYYLKKPIEILKKIGPDTDFYYPSTVYIKKKNNYSLAKSSFEEKVKKSFKNFKISIHRIPEINTRQNLSLLNRKLPSFTEYLNKNKNQISKIV